MTSQKCVCESVVPQILRVDYSFKISVSGDVEHQEGNFEINSFTLKQKGIDELL